MDKPTPVAYEADSSGNIYVEESDGQVWPTGHCIPRLASSRITVEQMEQIRLIRSLRNEIADLEAAIENRGFRILRGEFLRRDGSRTSIYLAPVEEFAR